MNKTLQFYNYEQCFDHYSYRIMKLRQSKINGEVIVAKPVLLLSLIEGIIEEEFDINHFELNEWLEDKYLSLMKLYTKDSQFPKPADIANPYWHLETDGFWHLLCVTGVKKKDRTPTKKWLKENIFHAWFDDDLWILLQNKVWRQKLHDFVVENKLMNRTI